METTKQISEHIESMRAIANMMLVEAAKGEKILEKMGKKKDVVEMEMEVSLLQRKLRVIKSCNKKSLAVNKAIKNQ